MSLSNPKVITALNQFYVPVYLTNEDYRDGGSAPAEEKAELLRIHREASAKSLSVGTVHAFILAPDGSVRDSMHTVQVAKPDQLLAMLDRNARALNVSAGQPIIAPKPPAIPSCAPGEVQLHLTSRYLERRAGSLVPVVSDSGDWSSLASEDWITLTTGDLNLMIPKSGLAVGKTWQVDPAASARLFLHFYPPTENWDIEKNRIRESELTGRAESVERGIAKVLFSGRLKMDHWFYHKPDGRFVEADVAGYADVDVKTRRLIRFRLITESADYKGDNRSMPFGVAIRSID